MANFVIFRCDDVETLQNQWIIWCFSCFPPELIYFSLQEMENY